MHTSILRRRPALAALTALLLAAVLVLFAPVAASAHDELIESDPAADSTVQTLPEQLRLTFSAAIIAEGRTAVEVLDPDGASVIAGEPAVDGAVVTQPLGQGAVAGQYRVLWQVTSSDGHLTSDEFVFTVATAAEPEPAEPAEPEAADDSADTAAAETDQQDTGGDTTAEDPAADDTAAVDADDAAEDTTFLQALPWIIIGIVLIAGGGALVAVLANRAKRRGPEHSDGASGQ